MSDNIGNANSGVIGNSNSPSQTAQAATVSQDHITAAGAVSSNKEASVNQKISSMEELRSVAPEVYKQMLLGIATNICSEMQRQQQRLKEIMRNGTRGY